LVLAKDKVTHCTCVQACTQTREMCRRINMQTHAGQLGLGITVRIWPLTFWPQGQCMPRSCHRLYIYKLRVQTNRQTDKQTNRQTRLSNLPNAGIYTASMGKYALIENSNNLLLGLQLMSSVGRLPSKLEISSGPWSTSGSGFMVVPLAFIS